MCEFSILLSLYMQKYAQKFYCKKCDYNAHGFNKTTHFHVNTK